MFNFIPRLGRIICYGALLVIISSLNTLASGLNLIIEDDLDTSYSFEIEGASGQVYPRSFRFSLLEPYNGQDTIDSLFRSGWWIERSNLYDYNFRRDRYVKVITDLVTAKEANKESFVDLMGQVFEVGSDAYERALLITDLATTTGKVGTELAKSVDSSYVDAIKDAVTSISTVREHGVFESLDLATTAIEGGFILHDVYATLAFYEAIAYDEAFGRLDALENADIFTSGTLTPVYRDQAWTEALGLVRQNLINLSSEEGFTDYLNALNDNTSQIIEFTIGLGYEAALQALKIRYAGFGHPLWSAVPAAWGYFISDSAEYVDGMHYAVISATIYTRLSSYNAQNASRDSILVQLFAQKLAHSYLLEVVDGSSWFQDWIFEPADGSSASDLRARLFIGESYADLDIEALSEERTLQLSVGVSGVLAQWGEDFFANSYVLKRSSDASFSSPAIVTTTSSLQAADAGVNSGIQYYRLYTLFGANEDDQYLEASIDLGEEALPPPPPPPPNYGLQLLISPTSVPVDGSSVATLTARVTENGSPVQGARVSFSRVGLFDGGFATVSGAFLSEPNDGLTDASGIRTTYFRPGTAGQTCQFSASASWGSDTASFDSTYDSGATVTIEVSPSAISGGTLRLFVEADVASASGDPIDEGTVRFTTNLGDFTAGDGAPGTSVTDEVSGYGAANTILLVDTNGTATITAEFIEGGSFATIVVPINLSEPPVYSSVASLTAPHGKAMDRLAGGTNYLAAAESDEGLAVWDMRDLSLIQYWDEDDFPSSQDFWKNPNSIAFSDNDDRIIMAEAGEFASFSVSSPNSYTVTESWAYLADEDYDVSPNGSTWLGVTDRNETLELYGSSGNRVRVVEDAESNLEGGNIRMVAYSPDGTRAAYTLSDQRYGPYHTLLVIKNTSSWSDVKRIKMTDGQSPSSVAWSPDSGHVAACDGDIVRIYDRNGNAASSIVSTLLTPDETGGIAWNPDGQHIAVHITDGQHASIFDVVSGAEKSRVLLPGGSDDEFRTLAWSPDGLKLFGTYDNSTSIRIYTPFDSTSPVIEGSWIDGVTDEVDEASYVLSGMVTEDSFLSSVTLELFVNGASAVEIPISADGSYSTTVELIPGVNTIVVKAEDGMGNESSVEELVQANLGTPLLTLVSYTPSGEDVGLGTGSVTLEFSQDLEAVTTYGSGADELALFKLVNLSDDTVLSSADDWVVSDSVATLTLSVALEPSKVYGIQVSRYCLSAAGGAFDGNSDGIGGNADDDLEVRFQTNDPVKAAAPSSAEQGGGEIVTSSISHIGVAMLNFSTDTVGATIRYTTDGSDPIDTSPIASTISLYENTQLKLRAFKDGLEPSDITALNVIVAPYTVFFSAEDNGVIIGDSIQPVRYGESTSEVTARADSGFQFVQWGDGDTTNPRIIENVTSNITISASFEEAVPIGAAITLIEPNSTVTFKENERIQISWSSSGDIGGLVQIEILKGGASFLTVVNNTDDDGVYSYLIPWDVYLYDIDYTVRVSSALYSTVEDMSDSPFSIASQFPALAVDVDTDEDGLLDTWEQAHFSGLRAVSGAGGMDPDGDGQSNWYESKFDLDPLDASERFRFDLSFDALNEEVDLTFSPIKPTRTYIIEKSSTLLPGSWMPVSEAATVVENADERMVTEDVEDAKCFYRVVPSIAEEANPLLEHQTLGEDAISALFFEDDQSGIIDGYTLTSSGSPASVTGKFGNAISFDGIDDRTMLDAPLLPATSDFTLSIWVYPLANDNNTILFAQRNGSSLGRVNGNFDGRNGDNIFNFFVGEMGTNLITSSSVSLNSWHHYVVRRSAGKFELFVDGQSEGARSSSRSLEQQNMAIGANNEANQNYFKGQLDQFLFYERALLDQEIAELYNSGDGLSGVSAE